MGFFHDYPYTDFHEINLDWILKQIMALHKDWNEFKAVNEITNAGAWDITKQYQAWTIVSDNNAGYISLKPVPAGVAIDNTEYWGLVADYDILITDLTNRISALEQGLSDLENDVAPVLDEYTLDHNMKILFVGDSYSGTSHWSYKTGDLFGLTLGTSYWVNAVGGEGFTTGTGDNGFLDELVQFDSDATVPNDEITHIIVCGGANDAYYDDRDIQQGISDFMDYAKAHFPNAKVYLGFIGAIINTGTEAGPRTQEKLQYACFMYSSITKFGGYYLAGLEYTIHRNTQMLDAGGLHPDPNAGNAIAQAVVNAVNGFNPIIQFVDQTVTLAPLITGDSSKTMVRHCLGPVTSFAFSGSTSIDINPGSSFTLDSGWLGTEVLQMNNTYFNRLHYVTGVKGYVFGVGIVDFDFIFNEDKISVRPNYGSGSFDPVTTTRVIFRLFDLVVPTLDVM